MSENEPPIKVKYVQRAKWGDQTHLYFRKGEYREGPLASADGTQELKDEVEAILKRLTAATTAAAKPRAGTVGAVLKEYNRSPEFLNNARVTQEDYQEYIDEFQADIGDQLLKDVTRAWVLELRNLWAQRGYRAANLRLQVLKNALKSIILDDDDTRIKGDPFKGIENVKRPSEMGEAHLIWTDAEVEICIEDAIARGRPGLARAVALGRYAGFRRKSICKVPLHARIKDYDSDGYLVNRLYWLTEKRKVQADMREDAKLTAIMDRTPNKALTIAYNADGNPWKERQLNQAIDRHMARLAKAGKVRAAVDEDGNVYCPLDIHGLRHARGVELARSGNSDAQIQAQLAQSTPAAAVKYRRQAMNRDLADAAQDSVDNVRDLRAKRKAAKRGTRREQKL